MKDKLKPCENIFCVMFNKNMDLKCMKYSTMRTKSGKYLVEICKNRLAFNNLKKKIKDRIEEYNNTISDQYSDAVEYDSILLEYEINDIESQVTAFKWVLEQIEGERK